MINEIGICLVWLQQEKQQEEEEEKEEEHIIKRLNRELFEVNIRLNKKVLDGKKNRKIN